MLFIAAFVLRFLQRYRHFGASLRVVFALARRLLAGLSFLVFYPRLCKFEISPCIGIGRIDPVRLAELLGRFFKIPQLSQDYAQVIMYMSVIGS